MNEPLLLWALLATITAVIFFMVIKHRFPSAWKRWRGRVLCKTRPRPRHSRVFQKSPGSPTTAADPRELIRRAEELRHREKVHDESGKNRQRIDEIHQRLQELRPAAESEYPGKESGSVPEPDSSRRSAGYVPLRDDHVWRRRQLQELEKRLHGPSARSSSDAE